MEENKKRNKIKEARNKLNKTRNNLERIEKKEALRRIIKQE